jgi:hypothetical protein
MDTNLHVAPRPSLRDRIAARIEAARLDGELARGADPEERPALALRARRLLAPRTRATLGRHVEQMLDDALAGEGAVLTRIRPRRGAVIEAADGLDAVAQRLLEPRPVAARGVARVRLLLTDGCGPLYVPAAGETLRTAVAAALDGLEPQATA